jgi:flagellin
MTSVNTNYGALVALQSLTQTNRELADVQNRVNTGLKVATAKDNGAVFAIAEGQRARVASLGAVTDGIDRALSVVDVGLSAGEAIGDILKQLKEKAVAAQATDLSDDQRAALQADFDALRAQVDQIANAATFNGSNLVNGTNSGGSTAFNVLTSDIGGTTGTFSLAGGTLVDGDTQPYSVNADLEIATGLTFTADQQLRFSITSADGSETTTLNVDLDAGGTIQDFIDSVASQTNGRVSVQYDEVTGDLTLSSNEEFNVSYWDDATTQADDGGVFGAGATGADLIAGTPSSTGANQLTITGFDFRLGASGQALETLTSALSLADTTTASAAADAIDSAITALNRDLASLGAQSKALDVQKSFLGKLSDSIEAGIGNLVDADLAKESARLTALQTKQQLGAQALAIANQAPSIVLSFFR